MTSIELEAIRTIADVVATAAISLGIPALGAWAVRKHLIQQRWVALIEAGAAAGYNAGRCAGTIDSPAFRAAASAAILDYAKTQGPDVLAGKGLTDDQTVQAGLARLSRLTSGVVGPTGSVPAPAEPAVADVPAVPVPIPVSGPAIPPAVPAPSTSAS